MDNESGKEVNTPVDFHHQKRLFILSRGAEDTKWALNCLGRSSLLFR